MRNYKYYAILCGNAVPKNIFEKIGYKLWRFCGVSPSGLVEYQSMLFATAFSAAFEETLKEDLKETLNENKPNVEFKEKK